MHQQIALGDWIPVDVPDQGGRGECPCCLAGALGLISVQGKAEEQDKTLIS